MKFDTDLVGFMQGRLSPLVNDRIQAFPWEYWQEEFVIAAENKFSVMEWTLDYDNLYDNPLLTIQGQNKIVSLKKACNIDVPSLTGDCFMQEPFWKADKKKREKLLNDFHAIIEASTKIGIRMIVLPLVDNGSIDSEEQECVLIRVLQEIEFFLRRTDLKLVFESDYAPEPLFKFISCLDPMIFGINYDIGNSAAAGFDPLEEISTYGHRIMNVHVKDRLLGGMTVPLGKGAANFDVVFRLLKQFGYRGNYILQTARAAHDHAAVLVKYRDMIQSKLEYCGS